VKTKQRPRVIFVLAALCAVVAMASPSLEACTLWAAAGDRAAQEGSLIAKNRDWTPEPDEVRLVRPRGKFRFLGLFPLREGKRRGAVAGINEAGLVVVTASAGSIPRDERNRGGSGLMERLLSGFPTVEAVLADQQGFRRTHPAIYLLADRFRIAWVEVAPGRRFAICATENGVLTHTNHYLDESLTSLNVKVGRSSRRRLVRIGELVEGRTAPLSFADFKAFSQDRRDGPVDSLWRTGSRPKGERTLASWVVSLPKEVPPEIFIRLANPGEKERTIEMTLDIAFWKRPDETIF